jgi:hypothetical protein
VHAALIALQRGQQFGPRPERDGRLRDLPDNSGRHSTAARIRRRKFPVPAAVLPQRHNPEDDCGNGAYHTSQ